MKADVTVDEPQSAGWDATLEGYVSLDGTADDADEEGDTRQCRSDGCSNVERGDSATPHISRLETCVLLITS